MLCRAAPAEQFAGLAAWAADEARYLDHGEREKVIGEEGRELQRLLLQATFGLDAAREERAAGVTSAAGIPHGTVERGCERGLASVFGPVRVIRMAYRNRREPCLYPADARQVLPDDPYSLGMRALAARHLAGGGFGQASGGHQGPYRGHDRPRPAGPGWPRTSPPGRTTSMSSAPGDAEEEEQPDSDVIMMQGDGKGIAMGVGTPQERGQGHGRHPAPGSRRWPKSSRSPTSPPRSGEPEDIAAPPARRTAHPGPEARGKWVSASVDRFHRGHDRRGVRRGLTAATLGRVRQRVFLVDGNKQQITAIGAQAGGTRPESAGPDRLHPRQRLPGQGRRRPASRRSRSPRAGGLMGSCCASCTAARKPSPPPSPPSRRSDPRPSPHPSPRPRRRGQGRHLPEEQPPAHEIRQGPRQRLAHRHRDYEGACRFVIEDRFGITGARWSPDGAEDILKIRAVVVNGDLDAYMRYYKQRYRNEHHLARYDPATIEDLNLAA